MNLLTKWLLLERRHRVSRFIETKSDLQTGRNFRTNNKLDMEEIHRHVHQLVHGDKKFMETFMKTSIV